MTLPSHAIWLVQPKFVFSYNSSLHRFYTKSTSNFQKIQDIFFTISIPHNAPTKGKHAPMRLPKRQHNAPTEGAAKCACRRHSQNAPTEGAASPNAPAKGTASHRDPQSALGFRGETYKARQA